MTRRDALLLSAVLLLALGLRIYDLGYPPFRVMDEPAHVAAATHYWDDGQFEPDFWEHPPLRHVLLYGFLRAFGDNPRGWRLRNVLFGALTAALAYLFAREVGGGWRPALLAGMLVATDPLHVVTSRYTYEEIYGGALFLAAIVVYLKHRDRSLWFVLSAILMGCALATKWYYVPGWLLIWLLALRESGNYRSLRTAAFLTTTWILVPLTVYVLSYLPWFGRGYDVLELVEHVVNSYHSLQAVTRGTFGDQIARSPSSLAWFTRPIVLGQGTYLDGGRGEFVLFTNDLPIWILTLPAMIGLMVLAARRRALGAAMPALLFLAGYALFLGVERPVFLYSAVPLLPFAFTAIACVVTVIAERVGAGVYYACLAAFVSWNAYLYPLVTAKKVPMALYRWIVEGSGITLF